LSGYDLTIAALDRTRQAEQATRIVAAIKANRQAEIHQPFIERLHYSGDILI
jgi:hypothetical protein